MKIWTNNSTEEVLLCDHGRRGPSNFVPQVVRRKDVLQFVQSPFAKPRARGNAHRVWSFAAKIEHDSLTAAQIYLLTLHQQIPAQADVGIELEDRETQYTLLDCIIEFSPLPLIGVLSTINWTLTFGGMWGGDGDRLADLLDTLLNSDDGTELHAKQELI